MPFYDYKVIGWTVGQSRYHLDGNDIEMKLQDGKECEIYDLNNNTVKTWDEYNPEKLYQYLIDNGYKEGDVFLSDNNKSWELSTIGKPFSFNKIEYSKDLNPDQRIFFRRAMFIVDKIKRKMDREKLF